MGSKKEDLIDGPTKNNLFRTTEKGIKYLDHFRELRDLYRYRDRYIGQIFRKN